MIRYVDILPARRHLYGAPLSYLVRFAAWLKLDTEGMSKGQMVRLIYWRTTRSR